MNKLLNKEIKIQFIYHYISKHCYNFRKQLNYFLEVIKLINNKQILNYFFDQFNN